jgi:hypothetical protein
MMRGKPTSRKAKYFYKVFSKLFDYPPLQGIKRKKNGSSPAGTAVYISADCAV